MGKKGFLLFLLLIMMFSVQLWSQTEWYQGLEIFDIRFTGLKTVSEMELRALLKEYIGEKFSDSLSWEIQGKLYALEYFDLIIPNAVPGDEMQDSIILEFNVSEKPTISEIIFEGNFKIRRGELRDTIVLKKGAMGSKAVLKMDEKAILDLYVEKGYIDVKVDSEIVVDEAKNTSTVYFRITEGYQSKIKEINFQGISAISEKSLKGVMTTKAQTLFKKGNYVESEFLNDLELLEQYYHDRGYINAKIIDVNKETVIEEEDNVSYFIITISFEEGEQYQYGGVSFSGNNIYQDEDLNELFLQKPGKVFNDTKFQTDFQRVVDLYYENGYIYNQFDTKKVIDEEKKVISIEVSIVETERAHIDHIILQGNDKTKDNVILRELPFEEGDVFSRKKIYDGMMNLYNTQYFTAVNPQPKPGETEGLMDLVLSLEEGRTADIQFQVTFAGGPDFPIAGKITLQDKNFLGRGFTGSVEAVISKDTQSLSLNFFDPYLFAKRFGGGADISYTHSANSSISQDIDGNGIPDPYNTWEEYYLNDSVVPADYLMSYESHEISLGLRTGYVWVTKRLGRFRFSTGLRTGFEYVMYDGATEQPYNESIRKSLNNWLYTDSIYLRLAWDTRDITYAPTKGFILSENITLAGILPVSNNKYTKSVTRFDFYLKLLDFPIDQNFHFKAILRLHTALSYLFQNPFYQEAIDPQKDGFYADGMFTARGWAANTDNQILWDNSLEIRMPIATNILAVDLFFDIVGAWKTQKDFVWENATTTGIENFMFSLGGGLRIDNNQFPIAFYLAWPFKFVYNGQGGHSPIWNPDGAASTRIGAQGPVFVLSFNLDTYGF